jgi:hypothetical protein
MSALPQNFTDREAWLVEAADMLMADTIVPAAKRLNVAFDEPKYKVSCGFPKGSRGGAKTIGVTYARSISTAPEPVNEIFISPEIDDLDVVLGTLAHELIHALIDCKGGHRGAFAKVARAINLEGPLTATHAGPELLDTLAEIKELLGQYPHAALDTGTRKKSSTRQRKCQCVVCSLILRMSAKAIEHVREKNGTNLLGNCPAGCGLSLDLDV